MELTTERLRHGIRQMRALMAIAAPESVVWFHMRAGIAWAQTELARRGES